MNQVYLDLSESNYKYKIHDLEFIFSSNFYLNKFKNEYMDYITGEKLKLENRYKTTITCDEMLLLSLYKKIEKRGFRVYYLGKLLNQYNIKSEIELII